MDKIGIIGSTGFIGKTLLTSFGFTDFFGRGSMKSLMGLDLDLLICAAPSGNRLEVQQDCRNDLEQTMFMIDHIRKANIKKFVLISTIDTVARPNTKYGLNRKILEGWVRQKCNDYTIIRLPTLIHPNIQKNALYDLKNKTYLDKLNPDTVCQFYDLTNLAQDIKYACDNSIKELNLFSEPISNQEIVDRFFPGLVIGQNAGATQKYNVGPFMYSRDEIFSIMEKYFNGTPIHMW